MNGFEPIKECIFEYTDAGQGGVKWDEPIVRCKDCEFFKTDELGDYCTLLDFEDVKSMADKFCAWGERKEGDE